MKKLLLPLYLLAAVTLGSCGTKETLVGQWQGPRERPPHVTERLWQELKEPLYTLEFFQDGTFTMATTHPDGFKSIVEGQYQELGWRKVECRATSRLVAGSRYEIAASQEGYEILGIKLTSLDKLSLTNWFGITLELRKVK